MNWWKCLCLVAQACNLVAQKAESGFAVCMEGGNEVLKELGIDVDEDDEA